MSGADMPQGGTGGNASGNDLGNGGGADGAGAGGSDAAIGGRDLATNAAIDLAANGAGDLATNAAIDLATNGGGDLATNGGGTAPSPFIDTAAAIHSFMTFDYRVTAAQIAQIAPHTDFVWGADAGKVAAWRAGNPKTYLTWYIPFNQDPSNQSLSWWQANHPDWVLYQCDKKTPATASGYPNIDLDFSNPAVQAWQLAKIKGAAAQGYDGVAFDLYAVDNAHHACGVYRNGQWVQLYSGSAGDPAFASASTGWLHNLYTAMHALPKPMGVVPNYTLARSASDATSQAILANVDAILDEDMPANWGGFTTGNSWAQRIAFMRAMQAAGKAYYAISEYSTVTAADASWSLASYLMGKEHHAALFVGLAKGSYGADPWRPEWATAIGPACGEMVMTQGVYARSFARGLAIANPSASATVSFTLPSTAAYKDLSGNAVSGVVSLPPHSGVVLQVVSAPSC